MITGLFKSVKGVLKFLANSSVYKYSISTVSRLRRLAISDGSPRTSLTPTGSNEPFVSNLRLWGGGGGSNVTRGGRFCNLLEKGLPPKKEIILKVGMSQLQKQFYQALLQKDLDVVNTGGGIFQLDS